MSNSVRPQRQQPTRLPLPWDSPGKNTGVSCRFPLQCMKVKSEREVAQSCPTLSHPMDCSPPGSSIRGIFQARVLEWGAIAFSRESSPHRDQICLLNWQADSLPLSHLGSPKKWYAAAAAKSLQLCLTLCNPIDRSPHGSSVPGILQARILEWVAISFSNA